MEEVTGIGGLFFWAHDPTALGHWYQQLRVRGLYPNGRFARLHDPEGNPIELWQPAGPAVR